MPVLATALFIRVVKRALYVYYMFDAGVLVIAMNTTLNVLSITPTPTGLPAGTIYSMDAYSTTMVYSYQNTIIVMDSTQTQQTSTYY